MERTAERFGNQREEFRQRLTDLATDNDTQKLITQVAEARNMTAPEYVLGDTEGMAEAMSKVFNFRKPGGERTDREELPNKGRFVDDIKALAERVGVSGDTEPQNPDADAVLILGGTGKAVLDRTAYAKELMDDGKLHTNTIVLLGSSKPLTDAERKRGGPYAEGASTEYELTRNAAITVFDVTFREEDEFIGYDDKVSTGFEAGWRISHASTKEGANIFVLSAPMLKENRFHSDGKRRVRANTADTYDMFARVAQLDEGAHVVAVTNAHFAPFQGADAVAEFGNKGIHAEVVGFDPAHFNNPPKEPEELLQESLSAVRSYMKALER